MSEFVVGAAVALVSAALGWLLGLATERWRERRTARIGAQAVFFEIGLLAGAARRLRHAPERARHGMWKRDAWDRYGGSLATAVDRPTFTSLLAIYADDIMLLDVVVDAIHLARDSSPDWSREAAIQQAVAAWEWRLVDLERRVLAAARELALLSDLSPEHADEMLSQFDADEPDQAEAADDDPADRTSRRRAGGEPPASA